VFLAAPNTSEQRLAKIDELSCFVYLVSTYGVTGAREKVSRLAFEALGRAKKICKKPVAIGFGVSKKEHVTELFNAGADAVVVGSAVVELISKFKEEADKKIAEFTSGLRP
ncbi:MAG: tryptophan synthase subunit alpha, partial [Archaeoglobaceae archaeon]